MLLSLPIKTNILPSGLKDCMSNYTTGCFNLSIWPVFFLNCLLVANIEAA